MRVVVPFAAEQPKTRLDGFLTAAERREFADAMLADVLAAIRESGHEPELLATAPIDRNVPTIVDERPLTAAVNAILETDSPVAIVMADLPLATPAALARLFEASEDVVLAPGRGGGTNALVARHPDFRVDYHGTSFLDHREGARRVGASVGTVDSFRLATDIDEQMDLAELLVHGEGTARAWLDRAGVRLVRDEGRVGVERTENG
ncbi:2-phospho-L-lactate guanylyltransferase [Halococcus thailandensis]|uniref:2-phospho-L-lactate guanylyltransferase n=1 Tax=Halococcus thailandensis JCM 13552 TaxID=1227457 RepID=M0N532_9EURY|nr:2-phospho-L-lactate guanylyltransferase [Halococcus thailandensis]EMA52981.1 phospholactate guanylyltransferase [Halococcus thailandensis JCM 13552]